MDLPFNADDIDFGKLERCYLSAGTSAIVYRTQLPGGATVVLKSPHKPVAQDEVSRSWEKESVACLKREIEVFKHLGPHPRIVRFIAAYENELLLEYHSKDSLTKYFATKPRVSTPLVLLWAVQLGEALAFLHSKDVIHGDFSAHNILVTDQKTLVLADFAGSPFRGRPCLVCYGTRYTSPNFNPKFPRKQDDFFALGSVLYEICSWKALFPDITIKNDGRIKEAYKAGNFPVTSGYILGNIIQRCWHDEYENAEVLLDSISKPKAQNKRQLFLTISRDAHG